MVDQARLVANARNSHAASRLLEDHGDFRNQFSTIASRMDQLILLSSSRQANSTHVCQSTTHAPVSVTAKKRRASRHVCSSPWRLGPAWSWLGIRGCGVPTSQPDKIDRHMSFSIAAPQIIGHHALALSINVRTYQGNPQSFQLLPGSCFDISRILPNDHSFLQACSRGDLIDVRAKLQSGEGRVSDRDGKNWTALAVSDMRDHAKAETRLISFFIVCHSKRRYGCGRSTPRPGC